MKNQRKAAEAAQHFDTLPDSARVRSDVVLALSGAKSLVTLWRWEKSGILPASRKVAGSRNKTWSAGEIRRALLDGGAA